MTSPKNMLREALAGLSKQQLQISQELSEKKIKEIQLTKNVEHKINSLTNLQKQEIGEFRLGIIRKAIKDHPEVDPYENHKMIRGMGF